jgi:CDP-L-myo-inositol myo-inositolphosphotransferase
MSKPQDGLVSQFLNRPVSRFITRFLLKLPIHPNIWTMGILVLPIIACVFLVRGDYTNVAIGAALLQVYSILDGCDGEIARARNLESKFGERLDNFCDFVASILFVVALGFGLHRLGEGIVCAALIAANECVLQIGQTTAAAGSSELKSTLYSRHREMIEHSGLLNLGERFVWWIMQLTKRDVAVFVFLVLALVDWAQWILHLWLVVAGASLILSSIAAIRGHTRRRDAATLS